MSNSKSAANLQTLLREATVLNYATATFSAQSNVQLDALEAFGFYVTNVTTRHSNVVATATISWEMDFGERFVLQTRVMTCHPSHKDISVDGDVFKRECLAKGQFLFYISAVALINLEPSYQLQVVYFTDDEDEVGTPQILLYKDEEHGIATVMTYDDSQIQNPVAD